MGLNLPRNVIPGSREVAELQDAVRQVMGWEQGRPVQSLGVPTPPINSNYNANIHEFILVDPSGGEVIVRLPEVTGEIAGGVITVKNITNSLNNITIKPAKNDKIDGSNEPRSLQYEYGQFIVVASDIGHWRFIHRDGPNDEEISAVQGTWQSGTTVDFAPGGRHSVVRVTLQDAVQRSFNGTLNWDSANGVADLGWDETASSAAGDKWIYFYLVPKSAYDEQLTVIASDNDPDSGGPTGYDNWRFIWSSYRSSTALLEVHHTGNFFQYAENTTPLAATGTLAADTVIQTLTLTNYIPLTASSVYLMPYWQSQSGAGNMFTFVYGNEDITNQTTCLATCHLINSSPFAAGGQFVVGFVPTPAAVKRVTYFREVATNNTLIKCIGWLDEWVKW